MCVHYYYLHGGNLKKKKKLKNYITLTNRTDLNKNKKKNIFKISK